jgi:hypothetical protein
MIAALKRQVKAAEYRDRASEASVLAGASALAHVREKHELAAARWIQLATLTEGDDNGGSAGS